MEKKELYELIGRLYAQTCKLSQAEEEWRQEAERAKSDNSSLQRENDELKFQMKEKNDAIRELQTDIKNRDATIVFLDDQLGKKEQMSVDARREEEQLKGAECQ